MDDGRRTRDEGAGETHASPLTTRPSFLILGARGQLGRALVRAGGAAAVGLDRAALDVTDRRAVETAVGAFASAGGGAVVNAAAYTAVDRAESEPDAARAVNHHAAGVVAHACASAGLPLVHVSTDYVFDGTATCAYRPGDAPSPLGVYGRTKADGEGTVRAHAPRHAIVRTAWVLSHEGHNFARTIHRLAGERDRLAVVADQHGHPTPADDLAGALLAVAAGLVAGAPAGTYHLAGAPLASWHDVAVAVVDAARRLGPVRASAVDPVPTSAYPTAARRPPRVELDMSATEAAFGVAPPDWRAGLARIVAALGPVGSGGA